MHNHPARGSRLLPVLLALALAACPSDTSSGGADTGGGGDSAGTDDTSVVIGYDTGAAGDTAASDGDTGGGACAGFTCPCEQDDDCASGLCVATADGPRCSERCTDGCPDGWDCRVDDNSGTDPVSACYPSYLHLCEPCTGDASCQYRGGERCIPATDPAEGSFCTSQCGADGACPLGYRCADLPFDGALEAHCVPESGACECRDAWADLGLTTDCQVVNAFGSCPGARGCGPDGLTACEGPAPAAETCNGLDDDCDGLTDNVPADAACTITNAFGSCPGALSCNPDGSERCDGVAAAVETCDGADEDCDGVTDEDTCDDGLGCTVDSCVAAGQCAHTPAAGACLIDGVCWAAGQPNPAGSCQTCDPSVSATGWSTGGTAASCLIGGQCVAAGTTNPDNACERCDPAASAGGWTALTPADGDVDGDLIPDACDPCVDADHDTVSDPGYPLGGCPGDACAAGVELDPTKCCTVGFGCAGDDHLVTSFSCIDPGGAADRHVAFYADFCCYDASDEELYCTSYGDWSAGSGRDTDPNHNPALAAVTHTTTSVGGQVVHDTDWTLVPNFFNQAGNFCQFTGEGWAVDDPAQTGDKASYPGDGYPTAEWSYTVDPSGGGDVACGGTTGTGTPDGCDAPVAGAPLHAVTLSLNADDGWQGWLNGASLGPEQASWTVVETSTHQLAEGCHVLAVHARDLHQVVSGFQGRVQIDGVDKYLTGTTRPLWRMTANAPPDQFGVTWLDRAYDAGTAAWFEPLTCTYTGWYGTAAVGAMNSAGAPMVWWGSPSCNGLGQAWVRLEIHVP